MEYLSFKKNKFMKDGRRMTFAELQEAQAERRKLREAHNKELEEQEKTTGAPVHDQVGDYPGKKRSYSSNQSFNIPVAPKNTYRSLVPNKSALFAQFQRLNNSSIGSPNRSMLNKSILNQSIHPLANPNNMVNYKSLMVFGEDTQLVMDDRPSRMESINPFKKLRTSSDKPRQPIVVARPLKEHICFQPVYDNPFVLLQAICDRPKTRKVFSNIDTECKKVAENFKLNPTQIKEIQTSIYQSILEEKLQSQKLDSNWGHTNSSSQYSSNSEPVDYDCHEKDFFELDDDDSFHAVSPPGSYSDDAPISLKSKVTFLSFEQIEEKRLNELKQRKLQLLIDSYRPTQNQSATEFKMTSGMPLDLTIKTEVTIQCNEPFEGLPAPKDKCIEMKAIYNSQINPSMHNLHQLKEGFDELKASNIDYETKIQQCLLSYHYPTQSIPSMFTNKLMDVLAKHKNPTNLTAVRNTRMDQNDRAIVNHFRDQLEEWEDSFQNLFDLTEANLNSYFYYFNVDFQVLFLSPSAYKHFKEQKLSPKKGGPKKESEIDELDNEMGALLLGGTKGLLESIRRKCINYRVPYLKADRIIRPDFKGLTPSMMRSYQKAMNPDPSTRAVFENKNQCQNLIKFLRAYRPPKLAQFVKNIPKLVSPTYFLGSQPTFAKLSHLARSTDSEESEGFNRVGLSGSILPSSLYHLANLLTHPDNPERSVSTYKMSFLPSLATAGMHSKAIFKDLIVRETAPWRKPKQKINDEINLNNDDSLLSKTTGKENLTVVNQPNTKYILAHYSISQVVVGGDYFVWY